MRTAHRFLHSAAIAASVFWIPLLSASGFTVIEGEVVEFTSPDDLFLDAERSVIAVNVINGANPDLEVNGVLFQGDASGSPSGTTTNGDVTVTTSRTGAGGELPTWATAPAFTGADPTSATNLGLIMQSIRWAQGFNAGDTGEQLLIDVEGLDANGGYDIQLLFNEGGDAIDRRFDIGVDGTLVVDDFSSKGGDGTWTASNSFAYRGEFNAGPDGTINIVLDEDLGGDPFAGVDGNPIIQAVIVHRPIPAAPTGILLTPSEFASTAPIGTVVGLLSAVDENASDTHSFALVTGAGDTNNGLFQIDGNELQTAADFTPFAGNTLSVRIEVEDSGGLSFVTAVEATAVADTDNDDLVDTWELMFAATLADLDGKAVGPGPGAGTGDFDGDGSLDLDEFGNGTDPTDTDSDDDGSTDGDEATAGTDPLDEDSDDDGLNDGDEATAGTNPLDEDSDDDSINDGDEVSGANGFVTNPNEADTDNDGVNDNLDPAPNNPAIFSLTTVFVGEVIEFSGPDDLHLDPATAVIAVDSFGNVDSVINGVTFLTDGPDTGIGTATNGAVTVTTTALNQIDNWANAGGLVPEFSGADPTSVANLAEVMRDIRWNPAPDPIAIDIGGLTPNSLYEIQLLFNEGLDNNRFWDIGVEDELVVDNISSEGIEAVHAWTPNNSAAYIGEFLAPADGILNILMQADLRGAPPAGTDNNPILQGIIVHLAAPATPFTITGVALDEGAGSVTVTWNSVLDQSYAVDASADLAGGNWIELDDGVIGEEDQTSFTEAGVDPTVSRFYRIRIP